MAEEADDGLPIDEVGEWAIEKHARLRRYIDISHGVRKRFIRTGGAGATYIDLYCGAACARVRETGQRIDGSPLVAFDAARTTPFSAIHLADVDPAKPGAALARLQRRGGNALTYTGPAEETVKQVCAVLDPYALHFAFLDPYSLGALSFEVIRELSRFNRMDMLIHVSAMDFQRNLHEFIAGKNRAMDQFAPGWRERVDVNERQDIVRRKIFEYWLGLVRSLDMGPSQGIELVTGSRNQPLYWLVFVARHERAQEFWEKIRDVSGQGELKF